MDTCLFERDPSDPDCFRPTELTRGPWSPDAQHGGAPAALLAMAVERHDADGARLYVDDDGPARDRRVRAELEPATQTAAAPTRMFVARLTIELLRPVPLTPLRVRTRTVRSGRKVQLIEGSLWSGEQSVALATGLRMRRREIEIPESARPRLAAPPAPHLGFDSQPPWRQQADHVGFHSHAVEHRFVAGGFDRPGPASDWIRLRMPVVAGEATPPISRVAAAADFGNGISWALSRADGYQFINPDLTIYLHRYPSGEQVCLDAITYPQDHGIGLAESRLWDEHGPIGRSLQSLLLDRI